MLLVHEWQVVLIERPETEREWARSRSGIKYHIFLRQYIIYTDGAVHESQNVRSKKSACSQRQRGS